MANAPHLFEDLHLTDDAGEENGIGDRLEIKGRGTFVFSLADDNGRIHTIKIPNSLYLPGLRQCLLSPQHWAQEAKDGQTLMGNLECECVLNWHRGGKKTVPFDPSTNTPIFTTAPSSRAYRPFATTFEALEAPYYQKETVLQYPCHYLMDDEPELAPEEFVAKENLNNEKQVDEGVDSNNNTVKTSNLPVPPSEEPPLKPFDAGPSPSTLHLRQKRKTSTSPLPTIKPSSCVGTTALAILPSPSSSSSPSTGKSPRSW
jgi:hypothetical protein